MMKKKFQIGDYVQHRHGYRGFVKDVLNGGWTIALERDDGIVGNLIAGCYAVSIKNLVLIYDDHSPLENE